MLKKPRRSPFTAETIAIGSELLVGGRSDSNSLFIAELLGTLGIEVRFKSVVGDDQADMVQVLKTAASRAGVVVMTGGLGPTVDDLTREAIAEATGRRLARRKEALDGMTARLAQWGRTPNKGQLRQAMIPSRATVIPNPVGSAPGFWVSWKGATVVSLPGVPREMEAMMTQSVLPLLTAQLAQSKGRRPQPITRLVFHTWGLPEAEVDARLSGLMPKGAPIDLGLLASPMGVLVSLTTRPGGKRVKADPLPRLAGQVRSRLGEWLFAEGRETMEDVVGRLLAERKLTVAVAESCTGGLIGHRLTQVPGSSAYVDRGAICYSNQSKSDMLGVPAELIAKHGAVSREVAASMAKGIRERAGVSVGLSVTGIAGPGGATETKPVGLVYVGLDGGAGDVITREFRFHGDRQVIKQRSSQAALDLLRRWVLDRGGL
ncbi:competence/damage-inducible protein A [Nitrospira sp. NS4]|uniref:competence/damage-inducible protein A n=1 Tax=Nitrospira sp. NS4 TaxID=3414498 RepID=UPI003C2F6422